MTYLAIDPGTTTGWAVGHDGLEEWRLVAGLPEYAVSNLGRVMRAQGGRGARAGKILKQLLNRKTGYFSVMLSARGSQVRIDVHRLVAGAFVGEPPADQPICAHWDGDRQNNRASNLRWASQSENLADMARHGTRMCGQKNPMAKILDADVEAIRRMKSSGVEVPMIAAAFGVHKRTVFRALARRAA